MDDALDWCELLVTDIVRGAHKEGEQTRLRTLHALAAAALHLWEALPVLLEQAGEARAIRPQTFARVSRARLLAAGAEGDRLTRPPDDNYYAELVERYHSVRRFVPTLGRTVAFEGTQAGQPRLKAPRYAARPARRAAECVASSRQTVSRSGGGSARLDPLYLGTLTRSPPTSGCLCHTQ